MKTQSDLITSGQRLKHIRILLNLSQKQMAKIMDISQSTLSQIENDYYSVSIPSLQLLQEKKQLNCNWLISGQGAIFLYQENQHQKHVEHKMFGKGVNVLLEPNHSKNNHNADDIPLIGRNAAAGHTKHAYSTEYLKAWETYQIPGFEIADHHRIFQVQGESMHPTFQSGDFLICESCDKQSDFESGDLVVVISEESIYCKRLYIPKDDSTYYIFRSDNSNYDPFIIKTTDIIELWKVQGRVTTKLYHSINVDEKKISKLEYDIEFLKKQIDKLRSKLIIQ